MIWLDDADTQTLPIDDRGLAYGDGVFETIAVFSGVPRFLDAHLSRLQRGLSRLGFEPLDLPTLQRRLVDYARARPAADWVKLIVTRGSGGRGYRPPAQPTPRVVVSSGRLQPLPARWKVRVCTTVAPGIAALAGLKHLNRLPQVMAARELADAEQEGILLDADGHLACGTMSNVFVVSDRKLLTPDVSQGAIAGVMRAFVLQQAAARDAVVGPLAPACLRDADEVFMTNALRGVVSVSQVDSRALPQPTPMADQLRSRLRAATP